MTAIPAIPVAMHVDDADCPWVDSFMGFDLKVVQVRYYDGADTPNLIRADDTPHIIYQSGQ